MGQGKVGAARGLQTWHWLGTGYRREVLLLHLDSSEDSAAGRQPPLQKAEFGEQATLVPRAGLQRGGKVSCKGSRNPISYCGTGGQHRTCTSRGSFKTEA